MALVLGPVGDPAFEQLDLLRREFAIGLRRRHHVVLALGKDAANEFALVRIAGFHDCPAVGELLARAFEGVQPELGLALVGVGAVARETVLREDRLDGFVVADPS